MLEFFAQSILSFTHLNLLIPFSILGYAFWDKKLFLNAFTLILLSILWAVALKNVFQVPLQEHLQGLAFPSGYMLISTVFYSWLLVSKKPAAAPILIPLFVCLIGASSWMSGYHLVRDLIAGVFFAIILLGLYYKSSGFGRDFLRRFIVIFSTLCIISIYYYAGFVSAEHITEASMSSNINMAYISYVVLVLMSFCQSVCTSIDRTK